MLKSFFRFAFFLVFVLILTFSNSTLVDASENFSTSYDVTYTIKNDGKTEVNFDVVLTNKTTHSYASSYKIDTGFDNIDTVKARDESGPISTTLMKNQNGTSLEVSFNKNIIGINKTLPFTVSFQTHEITKKLGSVWEVNIPGIAQQKDFTTFNVHVKTPPYFGNPTIVKPSLQKKSLPNLDFTKEQLGKSGISLSFGTTQTYEFNLLYHIENKNLFPVSSQIALPPETNYQVIRIVDISPKPQKVIKDSDGNWIALFTLLPSEKETITVKGMAEVSFTPKKQPESEESLKKYLKESIYWESRDSQIKELALSLKTPEAIFKYVVNTLTYDISRVEKGKERLGARKVLENPSSAVCLEFTDLFIALSRAAGIPAREVDGYAYTENSKQRPLSLVKDILHAWPEYYDKDLQTWKMVDPTWQNTTQGVDYFHIFDFDHLSFVIKGVDSQYPISPGGYNSGLTQTKAVYVGFSESVLTNKSTPDTIPLKEKKFTFSPFVSLILAASIGGVLIGICSIIILSTARRTRHLPFFRRKR